jgi:hypothetical protein
MRQHVGLGAAAEAAVIQVHRPDGSATRMEHVKADRLIDIQQPTN